MLRFFRKPADKPGIKTAPPADYSHDWRDQNPVAVARLHDIPDSPTGVSAAFGDPESEREYNEFCAAFCFRPGENLMDFVAVHHITLLQRWFNPNNHQPEPKAIIRLALQLMSQNWNLWDYPSIGVYVKGRWSQGGGPSQESQDAISVLSQVLDKPIKVLYPKTSDPDAMVHVLNFNPRS
ncbi:MAG: hypothetical protein M3Y56_02005 [Armatimonadota bacterium]|nr:hypothetical protein [Armatimonadota bacterium]